MNPAEIKEVLEEVLDERQQIDIKVHAKHHDFISVLIEEQRLKCERCERIKQQVYGWAIITVLAAIGAYVADKFW